jgi:hypothetical protein
MITPSEIKAKCLRIWHSDSFWQSIAAGETPVIEIPFGKLKAKDMLNDFSGTSRQVALLRSESKDGLGFGYTIEFTESGHRQLGLQKVPSRVFFETLDDFLQFIGMKQDFADYQQLVCKTVEAEPLLKEWVGKNPYQLLEHRRFWEKHLAVCRYFKENPAPQLYLRQLDVPGVDTKFIEGNKSILRDLLDVLLPEESVAREITGLSGPGFERRYKLKYEEPSVRFRILDERLAILGQVNDISIPASQFRNLGFSCRRVFFTENKTNFLCFPDIEDSIVVFGSGYGISVLKEAAWLNDCEIFYWGDIDTHGFSILSQLRGSFSHVHSILMDAHTLHTFKSQWGEEDENKRCLIELTKLTHDEWQLYSDLRDNIPGERVRLEQEKINFGYLCKILKDIQMRSDIKTIDRLMEHSHETR